MLATFMVTMEATIVATAMPRIVGQLGGFAFYTWVFSGYLLAQCTMTLIFGKLSDVFGRKPVMIVGISIFLTGSLQAGFAGSTVIGAILALGISHFGHGGQSADIHRLLNEPAGLSGLASDPGLRTVFDAALHWSFWGVLIIATLTFTASWLLPVSPDAR